MESRAFGMGGKAVSAVQDDLLNARRDGERKLLAGRAEMKDFR